MTTTQALYLSAAGIATVGSGVLCIRGYTARKKPGYILLCLFSILLGLSQAGSIMRWKKAESASTVYEPTSFITVEFRREDGGPLPILPVVFLVAVWLLQKDETRG